MRRPRTWPIAVALCLLAGLIVWLGPHRRGPLWPEAIPVELARDWIAADTIPSGYDVVRRQAAAWFWRSESELTCLRPAPDATVEWLDIDLATQQTTPRSPGPLLQPYPADAALFFWSASPDGRWFLQITRDEPARVYSTFALDGTHHRAWTNRYESHTHPEWLSDSSGFVEWPARDGQLLARIHWLDSGISTEIQLDQLPGVASSPEKLIPQPFVPLTKWPIDPGVAAELLVLNPPDNPTAWYRHILELPAALADYADVRVYPSPTGERLAWLAHAKSRIPALQSARNFPYAILQSKHRTTLLLSQPDGSDLRTLGRTPDGLTIERLQWSPAGHQIGFVYDDQLYVQSLSPP
jgi:hypothetical protein